MTVFVCVDDRLGRTFAGKRQSRDRVLCEDVLKTASGMQLYVHPSSAELFEGAQPELSEDPLWNAGVEDACFSEFDALSPYARKIDTLILYRWGRHYPADTYLDLLPQECGFRLIEASEFEGSSHECIRREVYKR